MRESVGTYCLQSISLVLVRGEDGGTLLIKKGHREILLEFADPLDREAAIQLIEAASQPIELERLLSSVSWRPGLEKIVEQLVELKILIEPVDISHLLLDRHFERALDNCLWEKELSWLDWLQERVSVKIIGWNNLGLSIAKIMKQMGISDLELIDDPYLRNSQLEEEEVSPSAFSWSDLAESKSLLIIADELGNSSRLLSLNELLLEKRIPFLPIFTLSHIGYIGPLVIPGRSSCFQCLLTRLEERGAPANLLNVTEREWFEWQEQSSCHPSLIALLSHLFAYQFTFQLLYQMRSDLKEKNSLPSYCNSITELDLDLPEITKRRLLPHSECPACKKLMRTQRLIFDFSKEFLS